MPENKNELEKVQNILKQLENGVVDFAEWIIENHDKAKHVERDQYNFTFEFETESEIPDDDMPDVTCKFWVGNDTRWLRLSINEMEIDIPENNRQGLWDQLEELAAEYPNYTL